MLLVGVLAALNCVHSEVAYCLTSVATYGLIGIVCVSVPGALHCTVGKIGMV